MKGPLVSDDRPAHAFLGPKVMVVIADVVAVLLAFLVATTIYVRWWQDGEWSAVSGSLELAALSAPLWVLGFVKNRLYSARFLIRGIEEPRRVVRGVTIGVVGLALADVITAQPTPRWWLLLVWVWAVLFVAVERLVLRRTFDRRRASGRMCRRVLVVGDNQEASELFELLSNERQLGYQPVGAAPFDLASLGDARARTGGGGGLPEAEALLAHLRLHSVDSVLLAATATDLTTSNALIRALNDEKIHVELSSTLLDVAPERLTVRSLGGFPVVYLEPVLRNGWRALAKRSFDIVFAGALLLCVAPIVVVAGFVVRLTSRGPALFRQVRVGRDGRHFRIAKLRTMNVDAELQRDALDSQNEASGPLFKMKRDPRVTAVGGFLRKSSIDELPQLWNVIRGEMSIVGPRPALPSEVDAWPENLHQRLRVRPGLTGMWQVSGRSSSKFEDYIRLDLYYVDNWSLVTDLTIVVRTIPALLSRSGAY